MQLIRFNQASTWATVGWRATLPPAGHKWKIWGFFSILTRPFPVSCLRHIVQIKVPCCGSVPKKCSNVFAASCVSQLLISSLKMTILRAFWLGLYFQHVSVTPVLMVQNFWNANIGNLILLLRDGRLFSPNHSQASH